MPHPRFFGYGSLVNRRTHDYPNARAARAEGWRREWVQTDARRFAYLSVKRDASTVISGLVAEVPQGDWRALDHREVAYDRLSCTAAILSDAETTHETAIYAVPAVTAYRKPEEHPILLSYLDVVLQGYLREFGWAEAERFLETTDGWEAPILDDRANPHYARHQELDAHETRFVDKALAALATRVIDDTSR